MLKEIVGTIIFGIIIGFSITTGLWKLQYKPIKISSQTEPTPSAITSISPETNSPTPLPQVTEAPKNNYIEIISPQTNYLVNQSKFSIEAKTSSQAKIAINTFSESIFLSADNDGNFKQELKLQPGANIIQISSFDKNDQKASKDLIITNSPVAIE